MKPLFRPETPQNYIGLSMEMDEVEDNSNDQYSSNHCSDNKGVEYGSAHHYGDANQVDSIWTEFAEEFPNFAKYEFENAMLKTVEFKTNLDSSKSHYPTLAVLFDVPEESDDENSTDVVDGVDSSRRPRSSSVSSNASTGLRRKKSSQIMIN